MPVPLSLMAARSRPSNTPDAYEHLDSLFRFAQVLTADADQAAALVEATYRQAQTADLSGRAKADLLETMIAVHQAERDLPVATAAASLHRRLAMTYVTEALPRLLATLPTADWRVLHLRAVEDLDWAEIARLLRTDEATVQTRFERARSVLTRMLYTSASPPERRLLEQGLNEDAWLAEALTHAMATSLTPLPPTLRSRVVAALRGSASDTPSQAKDEHLDHPQSQDGSRWRRALIVVLIIATAALTGYAVTTTLEREPEVNLIVLSASQADLISPSVQSNAPEAVERYIRDRLGWRIVVPTIDETILIGVDVHEVAQGVEVPVLLYQDTEADLPIILFTYTYALLNQYEDRIRLAPEILRSIERDRSFDLQSYDGDTVLIWRNRDDIFVAVTPLDDATLPDRISFPS